MGFSKKQQVELSLDSDTKKWVMTGISVRTSLKPITTKQRPKTIATEEEKEDECFSTTPTAKEARIPEELPCPPTPKKLRPPLRFHYNGDREFFIPPDLETVFKRHVETAN